VRTDDYRVGRSYPSAAGRSRPRERLSVHL